MAPPSRQLGQQRIARRHHHRAFHDEVGEQLMGDPHHLAAIERALDQIPAGGGHFQVIRQVQFSRRGGHLSRAEVGLTVGRVDVNFPEHRGSSSQG